RGWDITLAKIRFNRAPAPFSFSDGTQLLLYSELILRLEGVESIFALSGLNNEKLPLYTKKGDTSYLTQDLQGNFFLISQNGRITFDPRGRLIRIEDSNRKGIVYSYEEEYLVKISDSSGKAISFEYEGEQIYSAHGPGGKVVYYEYNPSGALQVVRDNVGVLTRYDYDEDGRLSAIYNGRGNKIFEAKYDAHHRAVEQMVGESFVSHTFNLRDRTAIFEGSNAYYYEEHFDPKYRPELIKDALGREIELTYGQDDGPQKMVTSSGLEVEYEYNAQGKLSRVYDNFLGERHFTYNYQGQITHKIDGEGVETVYQYDPLGHLVEKYHPFLLSSIRVADGQSFVKGNPNYLTSFDYDSESGSLCFITFPGGQKQTYRYNAEGLPIEIGLIDGTMILKEYDHRCRLKRVTTKGKVIDYDYDHRDHIIKIASQDKTTRFSYDACGNLTTYADPLARETRHDYDSFEKLTKTVDSNQGMTTYEYGPSGLCKMNLPNGSIREIFYDAYDRPTAIR
ncbi:MAG: hypothetical protein K1060chlam2_00747, partial [Chlamydiae bacterium]|nr:hypothetical protein [Chlamydiota bacterium]